MYLNLLYLVLAKVSEKHHLYLRCVSPVWRDISKRQISPKITDDLRPKQLKKLVVKQQLIHLREIVKWDYFDFEDIFEWSCVVGDKILIKLMLNEGADFKNLHLRHDYQDRHFISLMTQDEATWNCNLDLVYACQKGNLENIQLAIEKGATNWGWALERAFEAKQSEVQLEIIRFLIEKLENIVISYPDYNWNYGLYHACKYGNMEIVQMMIAKGANQWCYGLAYACWGGHSEIIQLMIAKCAEFFLVGGRIPSPYWNLGLRYACLGNQLEIAKLMISKGITDFQDSFRIACWHNNSELIQLLIDQGENNWDLGLCGACEKGHLLTAQMMLEKGAGRSIRDLNNALSCACESRNLAVVKLILDKGADANSLDLKYCSKFIAQYLRDYLALQNATMSE